MTTDGPKVYEVLVVRIQHLERTATGLLLVLTALTGVVLNRELLYIVSDWQKLALYLPFAVMTTIYYSLFLRIGSVARNLARIELKEPTLVEYRVTYFSHLSSQRKVTYVFVNAQCASPFMLVPLIHPGGSEVSTRIIVALSVLICIVFTATLAARIFHHEELIQK